MAVQILTDKFDSPKQLCRSCLHSRVRRGVGLVCGLTAEPPDYYVHCYDFKLFKFRDDKMHRSNHEYQQTVVNFFLALILIAVMVLLNLLISIELSLTILMLFLVVYAVLYAKKPMIVNRFGWFPYIYLIAVGYAAKRKLVKTDEELRIIQTHILKLMGWTAISQANEVLKKKTNSLEELEKYAKKLSPEESILCFSMVCEMYVFYNLNDFLKSDVLKEIAMKLNLNTDDYLKTKKKYETRELNFHKRIFEQKQREKLEKEAREKRRSERVIVKDNTDYYSVLGLKKDCSNEEIKKKFRLLAVRFHPDKFIKNEPAQEKAQEKFKIISEAYNYIRRSRGF